MANLTDTRVFTSADFAIFCGDVGTILGKEAVGKALVRGSATETCPSEVAITKGLKGCFSQQLEGTICRSTSGVCSNLMELMQASAS
jgi:hypothetical protein